MTRAELPEIDLFAPPPPAFDPKIDEKVGQEVQLVEDRLASIYTMRFTYAWPEGGNVLSFLDAANVGEDRLPVYYPRHYAMIEAIKRRGLLKRYSSLDATREFEGIDGSTNWAVDMEITDRHPGAFLVTWINRDEVDTTKGDGPNITRRVARQTLRYFPGHRAENVQKVLSMMEDPEEAVKL